MCFELSLFGHHFFGIDGFGLDGLNVLNLSHGNFGGLVFDLFFMKHDKILQLLMLPFIFDLEFIEPVIILFSQLKFGMYFSSKLFPDISEKGPEIISFSGVGSKGILQLGSECFNIGFIKLRYLDLH